MEKTLFVVIEKTAKELDVNTKNSIDILIKGTEHKTLFFNNFNTDTNLYYQILNEKNTKGFEYVSLVANGSTLHKKYLDIISDYKIEIAEDSEVKDTKAIYLPLVLLNNESIKGVLNSCIWKYNTESEYGYLDSVLALKQLDTTLYGGLVPVEFLLNEKNYDETLKFYQHFKLLNVATHLYENYLVIGVPKILMSLSEDLSYKDIENNQKVYHYKKAAEGLKKTPQEVVVVN